MALNHTFRATIEKPTSADLPLPDPRVLHPGPGNNWRDPAFSKDHNKRQTLAGEFGGKVPNYKPNLQRPHEPPAVSSETALKIKEAIELTHAGKEEQLIEKKYATLDDKVLRFYAYFIEPVYESVEKERVRKVTICYYPVDDTVMVQEPHITNSGLQGGTLLKRQQVRLSAQDASKPENAGETHLSVNHFNVGETVNINGRMYNIYNCDKFTAEFLAELGVVVGAPQPDPEDPFMSRSVFRATGTGGAESLSKDNRVAEEAVRTMRFIRDSGKVLRFFGYWDDRENEGILHRLDLRYFIEDDTISILDRGSGSDSKTFLSRRRLPKSGSTATSVELTFAGRVNGMREPFLGGNDTYYESHDLVIGGAINVFGRLIYLTDCDEATRDYMAQYLGVDVGSPIDISHMEPKKIHPKLPVPPPIGFGTHEDSLASCKSLVLTAPRKRGNNWEEQEGAVLHFKMELNNPERKEDSLRVFFLSFYIDDKEMMITENAMKNTGFTGGKFMKKQKALKGFNDDTSPIFYTIDDLAIGAVLKINSFVFKITECDQFTTRYLAKRAAGGPPDFGKVPTARLQLLLTAFQEFVTARFVTLTEAFRTFDSDKDGKITLHELKNALRNNQITGKEDEAVAILQQLDRSNTGYISYNDLFCAMSNPLQVRDTSETIDVENKASEAKSAAIVKATANKRNQVLKTLKERLETRCMTVFEMFRLFSTQPRAMQGRRAGIAALNNGAKDTAITPVQLRRGVVESLGLLLTDEEMNLLLGFFFPRLSPEEYRRPVDNILDHAMDLKEFQAKFVEMSAVNQLC